MELHVAMGIVLGFLGLCLGSFAGAQVWRLRAHQLVEDKQAGEVYDKKEYKHLNELTKHSKTDDRSRCLSCHHQLAWYDLVPLASWVSTKGRCRYCHAPIGYFEPLMEFGLATFFILSYVVWQPQFAEPIVLAQFVLWLVAGVLLAILFAYDFKWFLLPDKIVYPLVGLSLVYAALTVSHSNDAFSSLINIGESVLIFSGIYLGLWIVSSGRWIGLGDVKLGLVLGLLLGKWELALLALFLANLIGCLIVLPGLLTKKLTRTTQVPFGPMMIGGFVIAALWGSQIIDWYLSVSMSLVL
jgi:prepilin signal peptidase PulO-like enzyme (type II secretory pathway)